MAAVCRKTNKMFYYRSFPWTGSAPQFSFTSGCVSTDGRLTMVQLQPNSCVPRLTRGVDCWIKTPCYSIGIDAAPFGLRRPIRVELMPQSANDVQLIVWQESTPILTATAIANVDGRRGLAAVGSFAQRFGLPQEAFLACVRVLRHASPEIPVLLTVFKCEAFRQLSQVDRYWRLVEGIIIATGFNFGHAIDGCNVVMPVYVGTHQEDPVFCRSMSSVLWRY